MRHHLNALTLLAVSALCLSACSGKAGTSSDSGSAGSPAAAAADTSSNPLIGTWKFSRTDMKDNDPTTTCYSDLVFTATAQTLTIAGQQGTTQILYKVAGNKVYVSSDPSFVDAPDYIVIDGNTIEGDTSGECYYTRQ